MSVTACGGAFAIPRVDQVVGFLGFKTAFLDRAQNLQHRFLARDLRRRTGTWNIVTRGCACALGTLSRARGIAFGIARCARTTPRGARCLADRIAHFARGVANSLLQARALLARDIRAGRGRFAQEITELATERAELFLDVIGHTLLNVGDHALNFFDRLADSARYVAGDVVGEAAGRDTALR